MPAFLGPVQLQIQPAWLHSLYELLWQFPRKNEQVCIHWKKDQSVPVSHENSCENSMMHDGDARIAALLAAIQWRTLEVAPLQSPTSYPNVFPRNRVLPNQLSNTAHHQFSCSQTNQRHFCTMWGTTGTGWSLASQQTCPSLWFLFFYQRASWKMVCCSLYHTRTK